VHSLYQNLFITDLKDEIEKNGKDMGELRRATAQKDMENA